MDMKKEAKKKIKEMGYSLEESIIFHEGVIWCLKFEQGEIGK